MSQRGLVVAVAMTLAPAFAEAQWAEIKVVRVEAKPTRIDGSPWDGKQPSTTGCKALVGLALTAGAAVPGGALLASFLCAPAQTDRKPEAPDLYVQLVTDDVTFRTPVDPDTFSSAPNYAAVIPLGAIQRAGITVEVRDSDAGGGELIGQVRVTRQQILQGMKQISVLQLANGQAERVELVIGAYAQVTAAGAKLDVAQPPTPTKIMIRAGELVTISAAGTYAVANRLVSEAGVENKRDRNVPDLPTANNGAAIAYIGAPGEARATLLVGSCVTAIAPQSGRLHLGINDRDTFQVRVELPSLDQWKAGRASPSRSTACRSALPSMR